MVNTISAERSCQEILLKLRSSGLIFLLQETPYSVYITIRKRFRKDAKPNIPPVSHESELEVLNKEFISFKLSNDYLSSQNEAIKNKFEESVSECEKLHNLVIGHERTVEILHNKLDQADISNKADLKTLSVRNEKLVVENKQLKNEREDFIKEINKTNVALKSSQKDLKEASHRFDKKTKELENKLSVLMEFKVMKTSEEKELKVKHKKIEKKMRVVEEKEAKLTVERKKFERDQELYSRNLQNVSDDDNHNVKDDGTEDSDYKVFRKHDQTSLNPASCSDLDPNVLLPVNPSFTSTTSYCNTLDIPNNANIASYPSMVTHWLPPQTFYSDLLEFKEELRRWKQLFIN